MGLFALFCSLALSLVCLHQDMRQGKNFSFAMWLPTLWMMRVSSRSIAYWLPGDLSSWGDPVVLSTLTIMSLVVLAQRSHKLGLLFRENRAFLFFFIFLSISVLWTDDIFETFKRWF